MRADLQKKMKRRRSSDPDTVMISRIHKCRGCNCYNFTIVPMAFLDIDNATKYLKDGTKRNKIERKKLNISTSEIGPAAVFLECSKIAQVSNLLRFKDRSSLP